MAASIQKAHGDAEVELIDGGRGDFIVTVDGKRIWDKRGSDGRFPDNDEILSKL